MFEQCLFNPAAIVGCLRYLAQLRIFSDQTGLSLEQFGLV
jgi:hypothetical protein